MSTDTKKQKLYRKPVNFEKYPSMPYDVKLVLKDFIALVNDRSTYYPLRVYLDSMIGLILSGAIGYEDAIKQARAEGYGEGLNAGHGTSAGYDEDNSL